MIKYQKFFIRNDKRPSIVAHIFTMVSEYTKIETIEDLK